jgi:hypothetical protein
MKHVAVAFLISGVIFVNAQPNRYPSLPPRHGGNANDGDCKTFDAEGFCVCNAFEHISCLPAGDAPFNSYSTLLETLCDTNCTSVCTYYIDTLYVHYAECPLRKASPRFSKYDQAQRGCMNARRWSSLYTLGLVVGACTPKVTLTKEEGFAAAATVTGLFVFLFLIILILSCAIGHLFQFRAQMRRKMEIEGPLGTAANL